MKASTQFHQGRKAFEENRPITANPYDKPGSSYEMWDAGWKFAQALLRNK